MNKERKIFLCLARTMCLSTKAQAPEKVLSFWDCVCVVQDAQVYDTSVVKHEGRVVVVWIFKMV